MKDRDRSLDLYVLDGRTQRAAGITGMHTGGPATR